MATKKKASKVTNLSVVKDKKDKSKASKPPLHPSDAIPPSFPEDGELPGMETPRNAKLEQKGREIAHLRSRIKRLQEEEKGKTAEALVIMHEHEIKKYSRDGVVLIINEKESLAVEVS